MAEKEHEEQLEKLKEEIGEGFTDELDKKVSSLRESLSQLRKQDESLAANNDNKTKQTNESSSKDTMTQNGCRQDVQAKSDFHLDPNSGQAGSKEPNSEKENEKRLLSQASNNEGAYFDNSFDREQKDKDSFQKNDINENKINGSIGRLESSMKHLDSAIQSLIKIIDNAKNEFRKSSETEQKIDEVLRQNREIISMLNQFSNKSENKNESEKKEQKSSQEFSYQSKSPFMPKPNLPHIDYGIKKNPAPRPPEEDNDTTIPYLKPRNEKKRRT